MTSRALAALAICSALAAAYVRCAVYGPSLLVDDGGTDGPIAVDGGDGGSGCAHVLPPGRPAADDPSDADVDFLTAVDYLDFGLDGGVAGYDLDRTCTCPDPESCTPSATASPHCDGEGGADNSGGALLAQFAKLSSQFDPSSANTRLGEGRGSIVIRVTGYNGTPNDTNVHLAIFISDGTVPLDDAGSNPTPLHDGTDQWGIDPASLIGTPPPYVATHEDTAAYVTGGVVVASVDLPLGLGFMTVDFLMLHGAYVTARIVSTPNGYALKDGIIAGRWDTRNLLTGLAAGKDPLNSTQYLCGSDPTYQAIKTSICNAADITRYVQNDNTGAPCDALSLAIAFTAEPALFGGVLSTNNPMPTPCGPSWTDSCGN